MENKVLPAVRVPTVPAGEGTEDGLVAETPIVDLPPSEKFGFAWPDKSKPTSIVSPILSAGAGAADLESEFETSEAESQDSTPAIGGDDSTEHTPVNESPTLSATSPSPPRLSRAFSMPLPSQLGHLRNPHRSADEAYSPMVSPLVLTQPPNTDFRELSLELADSVQMVVQTLLQISPPHLLDPAKEQFSACSLSVPSPSITAMLTAMKNLNFMSANMSTLADNSVWLPDSHSVAQDFSGQVSQTQDDFDIGEMLQSVGDSLSGLTARAGVELVLFHGDVGMKHVSVRGDEGGLSYALSHIIRQVLETTQRGDTLEIGLFVAAESHKSRERLDIQDSNESDGEGRSPSRASSSALELDGPLQWTFNVGHKFATPDSSLETESSPHVTPSNSLVRSKPRLDTILLRRLLKRIGGTVKEDLQPHSFSPGRSCDLTVVLGAGSAEILSQPTKLTIEEEAIRQPFASMNIQLASEPSLEVLLQFAETLKGKKVALHASAKGSFAHHLTSYLTAWGLDVSHMSAPVSDNLLGQENAADIPLMGGDDGYRTSPMTGITDSPIPLEMNPMEEQLREKPVGSSPTFVLIDDDVDALRQRLIQLRSEAPFNLNIRQRPKLAHHHRPKSSPQIFRAKGIKAPSTMPAQPSPLPVIIHFTSLSSYKLVKDLIHSILSTPGTSNLIPEIIVLPKPAGPRRLLTALRTAIVKPIVDPFFTPIATSPLSPNGQGMNPFFPFSNHTSPSQKSIRPAISPRTASDRSSKSSKDAEFVPRLPPSPLREADSLEYFSEAAVRLGTSPSSGLVIQSPDGQPAGIFFHPRGAGTRNQRFDTATSSTSPVMGPASLVRDTGNLRPPGEHRRSSMGRRGSASTDGDTSPAAGTDPLGRPAALLRSRSGLAHIDEGVESSEAQSRQPSRMSPVRSPMLGPQITNTAPTPPTSLSLDNIGRMLRPGPAIDVRKSSSPPLSPVSNRATTPSTPGAAKRSYTRRWTQDSASYTVASGKKGKQSTDNNITPPVNVLIVEDNPINQTILSTFMRKRKIKYDVAKDGAEAVAKWKAGGFHLILMDIQMPIMDGIEATKEIRRLERQAATFPSTPPPDGQQTPSDAPSTESRSTTSNQTPFRSSVIIVALTASSLPTDRVAALAAGCNDFLTKPVSLLWLNNKIIEWGSIKALQMWADLRPEVMKSISHGQVNQARSVASRLHVPESRKASRASSPPSPKMVSSGTSQLDAIRLLSTVKSFSQSRDPEHVEPQHDSEARGVLSETADSTKTIPTPSANTESESLSAAETVPEVGSRLELLSRPDLSRVVTGDEALRAHLQDSQLDATSLIERMTMDSPVVLGERTISSGVVSIAELMHNGTTPTAAVEPPEIIAETGLSEGINDAVASSPPEGQNVETPAGDPPQPGNQ
ncbi:hypothetical protein M0805_007065 [Coniferiporia weirii]|nr:hypothetical protein M0805_007065 [Coniferiporia weirii]